MSYEKSPDYGGKDPTIGGVLFALFLVVAAVAAFLGWLAIAPAADAQEVKSLYWSDGDSGRFDGKEFRLADVDAPETGNGASGAKCEQERAKGYKAKEFMVELTRVGRIIATPVGEVDRYGRHVLNLSVNGKNVAVEGKNAGHLRSWRHEGSKAVEPKPNWC
jgi:endonuclease YncB( thermonuclease family)